jgi:hypothetical protein
LASVADVAQLVEQRFRKAQVAGSSPVIGSISRGPAFLVTFLFSRGLCFSDFFAQSVRFDLFDIIDESLLFREAAPRLVGGRARLGAQRTGARIQKEADPQGNPPGIRAKI